MRSSNIGRLRTAVAGIAKVDFTGDWIKADLLVSGIIHLVEIAAHEKHGRRTLMPLEINPGRIAQSVEFARETGVECITAIFFILVKSALVVNRSAELPRPIRVQSDRAIVGDIALRRAEGIGDGSPGVQLGILGVNK